MAPDQAELRLPIVAEEVTVERRAVETDRVRVRTVVDTDERLVEESVRTGSLTVERLPMDHEVAAAPGVRQEGDTTIFAIVEERLVVEKRLFVVEEVRVTRSSRDEAVTTPVSLRRMRAVVERADPDLPPTERS